MERVFQARLDIVSIGKALQLLKVWPNRSALNGESDGLID